jgi:dienelactone hydrolase
VFSHGLNRLPRDYEGLLRRWAGAGFVVVAPRFPLTHRGVELNVRDVLNQPADASFVLTQVLALDGKAADPFRGHLDGRRLGAAGHSGGGVTTVGLFAGQRDDRLRSGIVLAGNGIGMGDSFPGPPASLLFVHGDRDTVVPISWSQAVFGAVPWPKAFLTIAGGGHVDPYEGDGRAFSVVAASTIDFLRATLYGDAGARSRLNRPAAAPGRLDNRL